MIGALSAVALCGVALARPANSSVGTESPSPRVVEVVRYATQGDYTVEKRFWIDADRVPDAEAVADSAMGAVQDAATVTAQYKVGTRKWAVGSLPLLVSYNPAGSGSNTAAADAIMATICRFPRTDGYCLSAA